jgi:hypothetical protein
LAALLKHIRTLKGLASQAGTVGLFAALDNRDPLELLKINLDALLTDQNFTVVYQMVSDATLNDDGTLQLKPETVAAMNQFDAIACLRAAWSINVRPHLALLFSQATRSAPLTTPAPASAHSGLTGGSPATASPAPASAKFCAPACA